MTVRASRLPFSLDPLMAEAKRRARQRRVVVAFGVVLLAGLAAGLTLAFRSGGGPTSGPLTGRPVTARYPGFSLRYPSTWTRVYWGCVRQGLFTPIAVLTNAQPAPKCPGPTIDGGFVFPPRQQLGTNAVLIYLDDPEGLPGEKYQWNARIDGKPADIARPAYSRHPVGLVTCAAGGPAEYRSVLISVPGLLAVGATICGPNLAAGNAPVNRILASLRFTR